MFGKMKESVKKTSQKIKEFSKNSYEKNSFYWDSLMATSLSLVAGAVLAVASVMTTAWVWDAFNKAMNTVPQPTKTSKPEGDTRDKTAITPDKTVRAFEKIKEVKHLTPGKGEKPVDPVKVDKQEPEVPLQKQEHQ